MQSLRSAWRDAYLTVNRLSWKMSFRISVTHEFAKVRLSLQSIVEDNAHATAQEGEIFHFRQ